MKIFRHIIIGLLILTTCLLTQDKELVAQHQANDYSVITFHFPKNSERFNGVNILNTGPRGGDYLSSKGSEFDYRIFRIQIFNDTIIPIKLDINLPSKPSSLLPDFTIILDVFLIPDNYTPDSIQDVINFGVRLEEFFESGIYPRIPLITSIQPKEQRTIYIGILFKTRVANGTTRAQLFVDGQNIDAQYFPIKPIETPRMNASSLDLVYGIAVDPPNFYTLISCGQILFEK